MEFLKDTDFFDLEGKAFYNSDANMIEIFLKSTDKVICLGMLYSNMKKLFESLTIEKFKNDFEIILDIISEQDGLMDKVIIMQAFTINLWDKVLDGFKNVNMGFIHLQQISEKEYIISSERDNQEEKWAKLQMCDNINKLILYKNISLEQHKVIKEAIKQIGDDIKYKIVNQY